MMARLCILVLLALLCVCASAASFHHGNLAKRVRDHHASSLPSPFKRFTFPEITYEASKKILDDGYNSLKDDQREAILHWQKVGSSDADARKRLYGVAKPKGFMHGIPWIPKFSKEEAFTVFDDLVFSVDKNDNENLAANWRSLIYEDKLVLAFLPAGGPLKDITPNSMNPYGFHAMNNYAGANGRGHILVIPRKTIYNAVTLDKSDIPLLHHMEAVGKKLALALLTADSFPPKSIEDRANPKSAPSKNMDAPLTQEQRHKFSAAIQKTLDPKFRKALGVTSTDDAYDFNNPLHSADPVKYPNDKVRQYLPGGLDLHPASPLLQDFTEDKIKAYFQVTPNNSVGLLHMHIIMPDFIGINGWDYFTKAPELKGEVDGKPIVGAMTPVAHVIRWVRQHTREATQKATNQKATNTH